MSLTLCWITDNRKAVIGTTTPPLLLFIYQGTMFILTSSSSRNIRFSAASNHRHGGVTVSQRSCDAILPRAWSARDLVPCCDRLVGEEHKVSAPGENSAAVSTSNGNLWSTERTRMIGVRTDNAEPGQHGDVMTCSSMTMARFSDKKPAIRRKKVTGAVQTAESTKTEQSGDLEQTTARSCGPDREMTGGSSQDLPTKAR